MGKQHRGKNPNVQNTNDVQAERQCPAPGQISSLIPYSLGTRQPDLTPVSLRISLHICTSTKEKASQRRRNI